MALARLDSAVHVLNSACGEISVAGFALSVFSCTGFGKQASLFPCLKILARLIANAQKTPFAQMCKGRMSRGTTFSCKALLRISFFCNGKSRNHLLTWKHPTLISLSDLLCRVFSTHSFCFRFSNPVQKLPSAPALPDDLSAGGSSSLMAPGAYSSFSSLFSYLLS